MAHGLLFTPLESIPASQSVPSLWLSVNAPSLCDETLPQGLAAHAASSAAQNRSTTLNTSIDLEDSSSNSDGYYKLSAEECGQKSLIMLTGKSCFFNQKDS